MKKLIISLLLLVPVLSGCANVETMVTINDDKSATVATSLTYQGDLASQMDVDAMSIAQNYKNFLDPAYKIDEAYGARLSTITATKSVKNLSKNDLDLSSLGFTSNLPDGKFIEIKKSFLVTSYNIDCTYDFAKQASVLKAVELEQKNTAQTSGFVPEYFQKYADIDEIAPAAVQGEDFTSNLDDDTKQFVKDSIEAGVEEVVSQKSDFSSSFSVQVPTFASFNNADSVNGTVYTWNIRKDSPTVIKLQYVQYSGFAIGFIILLGILLLVVLARKILKHDSQKRIDNVDNIV